MLQIRHFSNRLLANKLGRTFSTNWRSSSTKIFGAQFSPIQSANGYPNRCIILPEFKKFCQRHQFCSAMADGSSIPPFPPHSDQQSANSSPSSIPSPEMATNVNGEQKTTKLLEYRKLHLNNLKNKTLRLILEENEKYEQKFFKLTLFNKGQRINIPGIPMPEDGYPFVWGMDNLIGELASGNIDPQKYKGPLTTDESAAADDSAKSTQMVELSAVEFTGQTRKFQLGLVLLPADDGKGKGEICFQTRISPPLKKESGKWSYLTLPLQALVWLRREIAEMLEKYDGKQAIGEAAQIPRKFFPRNYNVNNSSPTSSILSPKMSKNAEKMEIPARIVGQRALDLNKFHNKFLRLYLKKEAESGQKFFLIMVNNNAEYSKFPIIPVPQDAYAFVRAMEELIGELAAENFDVQKFIDKHQSTIESTVGEENFKQKHAALKFAEFSGQMRKFQLELVHFPNAKQRKRQIFLQIRAFKLSTKKWKWMTLPLEVLPWLRAEMAEMLIKNGETGPIGEAAQIKSVWNDAPRFATQKFNFDGKLDRQMRPKIENKIPQKMQTTFPSEQKYSKMEPKIQSTNFDQFGNKKQPEKRAAQFDPQIADLEESLRILFDFEDEEDSSRGKKYGREAANNGRGKFPRYEF